MNLIEEQLKISKARIEELEKRIEEVAKLQRYDIDHFGHREIADPGGKWMDANDVLSALKVRND